MKVLKWIGIALGLLIALFLGFGLFGSTDYALARSKVIDAPPEKIHEYVGDLNKWPEWTPFYEDETMEVNVENSTGVGARQSWSGKDGDGRLEITESDSMTGIAYDMAFIDGENELISKSTIRYEVVDGGTRVTWEMNGDMDIPVMGPYLAAAMPSMVGVMFDQGLTSLEQKATGTAAADSGEEAATGGE